MRWIRILDQEDGYARTLGAYLEKQLPGCRMLYGEATGQSAVEPGVPVPDAVVAGSGYRDWQEGDASVPVLRLAPWICRDRDDEASGWDGVEGPGRLGSAREIADAIARMIRTDEPPHPKTDPNVHRQARVVGLMSDACDPVRKGYIERLHAGVQEEGGRAVYLPLLPAYRTACTPMSGNGGSSLTQLLLHAMTDDPDDAVMGTYLHPARSGVLCVPPAESHEHLLQCGPDSLRRIIAALSRWMDRQPAGSLALVDLAELPDNGIAAILAMCGEFRLLVTQDSDSRSGFNERMAPLTARLPVCCRLTRVRVHPPCRPDINRPVKADKHLESEEWV